MPFTEYLFIDESGDPGSGEGDSSSYYAELLLHITDEDFPSFIKHVVSWRYIRGLALEMKRPPKGRDMGIFLRPFSELQRSGSISCSGVYLIKDEYTGPYLKPGSPRGENPILFRNFIHRQLLEYHFSLHQPATSNIELIFDRFEMSHEAIKNLEDYLRGNIRLPDFKHITHADSLYTEALQVASQLVNLLKDIALGKASPEQEELLSFISLRDITKIRKQ